MVRFGEDLEKAIFPIWRSYYIDYSRLKKVLEFVRETYPYLDLLANNDVIVLNDPTRPFELVITGALFTFTDTSGSTNKNCRLRVVMHNTHLPLEGRGPSGGLSVREHTADSGAGPSVFAAPEGYSLYVELDESRAGLLVPDADLTSRFTASNCLRPHSKGYAMRLRDKFLKDLASLKIGKEIADSVGGAVMTLFLDGSSASKAKDRGGVSPRLAAAAIPQPDAPASPSGVKGVVKDLTAFVGGVTAEQREELRVKREEGKSVPKEFRTIGAALDGRPTTMSAYLPSAVAPLYTNPSLVHALYLYHLEVSNILAQALKEEVEKVSNFYISQSHVICGTALLCADAVKIWKDLSAKERSQIRIAFRQTYSTLDMLQQFCDMNCLAIAKILKKYDKRTHQQMLTDYKHSIENVIFKMGHDSRIYRLQKALNAVFSRHVMRGDHKQGLSYLDSRETVSGRATELSLAVLIGIVGTMAVVLLNHVFTMGGFDGRPDTSVFPPESQAAKYGLTLIFIPFILAFWAILFATNVMVWEHFGINFAFMFELDPIFHWTGTELMRDSLMYVLAWMLCVYQFLLWNTHESLCVTTWDVNAAVPPASEAAGVLSSVLASSSAEAVGTSVVSAAAMAMAAISSGAAFAAQSVNSTTTAAFEYVSSSAPAPTHEFVDNTSIAPLYWVFPIWIVIFIFKAVFNHFYFNNRKPWIAITVWRSISIPLYQVKFSEFIICNNIASISGWFFEMTFYWCPLVGASADAFCSEYRAKNICAISILPSWWRLLQCFRRYYDQPKATRGPFPNLINAGKYAAGCIALILWNVYYTLRFNETLTQAELDLFLTWVIGFQIFTQFYYYAWDIVVDAGIWIRHDDGVWRLREEKVYGVWWPYVWFCILNIPMTSTWAIKLAFAPFFRNRPYMWVVWTAIEVARRSYWNLMRVENEHVNNTEGYRATRFAPIPAKRIVAWDTMADDLTERFLRSDKEKGSEEFPDIKGVNFTGVTKFFANLPDEEQINILRGLNAKSKEGAPSGTLDGHQYNDTPLTTVITTIGADGREYATHLPCLDPSLAVTAGPAAPPLPSVIFSSNPASNPSGAVHSDVSGCPSGAPMKMVDKAKFFSELPEEIKVCLVLEYLGVDETMNAYLKRVTGSEMITSKSGFFDPAAGGGASGAEGGLKKKRKKKKRSDGAERRRRAASSTSGSVPLGTPAIAAAAAAEAANAATDSNANNLLLSAPVGFSNASVSSASASYSQVASDHRQNNNSINNDSPSTLPTISIQGANGATITVAPLRLKSISATAGAPDADARTVSGATSDAADDDDDTDDEEYEEDSDAVSDASDEETEGERGAPPTAAASANRREEHSGSEDEDGNPRHRVIRKIPTLSPGAMLAMAFSSHDDKEAQAPLPALTGSFVGSVRHLEPSVLSSPPEQHQQQQRRDVPLPPNPFAAEADRRDDEEMLGRPVDGINTAAPSASDVSAAVSTTTSGGFGGRLGAPTGPAPHGYGNNSSSSSSPIGYRSAGDATGQRHLMGATLPPESLLDALPDVSGVDT